MSSLDKNPSRGIVALHVMRPWKVLAAICMVLAVATIGYVTNHAGSVPQQRVVSEKPEQSGGSGSRIESFDVGLRQGRHRIQLGTDTKTVYRTGGTRSRDGVAEAAGPQAEALQKGWAQPLSMGTEDFDGDGMSDLVIGYSSGGGGLVTLRRGNIEAIAPRSAEVLAGLRAGRYPSPFVNEVDTYGLLENPDYLMTGDFDGDGYADVVTAARGSVNLFLLAGDGRGGLKAAEQISLPGSVTALAKGEFNERNGVTSLAVGVTGPEGSRVLVFDEIGKGVRGPAESFGVWGAATALAIGQLDDDTAGDLAIAAGNRVTVIHGWNPAEQTSTVHYVEGFVAAEKISAVAVGNFVFDREGKNKLALLTVSGQVEIKSRGGLDTRPFTAAEQEEVKQQRIAVRRGLAEAASLRELQQSLVRRGGSGWQTVESR